MPLRALSFHAETEVSAPPAATAKAVVRVTNTVDEAVTLEPAGGCVLLLKAFTNADRSGTPVWDQTNTVSCTGVFQAITLGPGQTHDFQLAVPVSEIVNGTRPAGHYYFTAVLRLNHEAIELPAGDAELAP